MKKFLSVLLALAVAFTFTFGSTMSAFAATSEEVAVIEAGTELAYTAIDNNFETAFKAAAKDTTTYAGITLAATSWNTLDKEAMKTALKTAVNKVAGTIATGTVTQTTASAAAFADAAFLVASDGTISPAAGSGANSIADDSSTNMIAAQKLWITANYTKEVALYQYKADLDEIVSALDKVDYSQYSNNVADKATGKTYSELAHDAVDAAKAKINLARKTAAGTTGTVEAGVTVNGAAYTLDSTFSGTELADSEAYIAGLVSACVTEIKPDGVNGIDLYLVKGVKTSTEEAASDATDSANAAAVKAEAQRQYATFIADTANAAYKAEAAAWLEAVNYLADEGVVTMSSTVVSNSLTTVSATAAANAKNNVADMNIEATKAKNENDANGNPVRDAKKIDKAVTVYATALYKNAVLGTNLTGREKSDCETAIANALNDYTATTFKFDQDQKVATLEKIKTDYATEFYPAELESFNAAVDAAIAKAKAATTSTELDKVSDTYAVVSEGIATKGAVDYLLQTTYATTFNAQKDMMINTIDYVKNAGKTSLDADYIDRTNLEDAMLAYYGENGIRTVAAMKAADREAIIATLPTKGAIKAAYAAAKAAVEALPATIKATDRDKVEAAFNACAAYKELTGNSIYTTEVSAAVDSLWTALNNGMSVKVAQTPTTDKAALKAVLAEIEELEADKENPEAMFYNKSVSSKSIVTTALDKIRDAEKAAVIAAIKALPINVTAADKAQIEAARAAYDAFVTEYNDPLKPYNAVGQIGATSLEALQNAEAMLAIVAPADEYTDVNAKADLLDMSRKLTIWRTSKTSIKVTAVGSVKNIKENGYTVKYSFYKKNPGASSYKLIKTTTSNKYTYTNLKKGTNKFQVKVKVYDADGKLVATKMTYYRAAKVK